MSRSIHSCSGLPGQLLDSPVKSPDPLPRPPYHPTSTQPTPYHSLASEWYPYVTPVTPVTSHHSTQPIAPTLALNYSRWHHPHDACINAVMWLHDMRPLI